MDAGRLFEGNRPPEILPPGSGTPGGGIPVNEAFLGASDPDIFVRLRFP